MNVESVMTPNITSTPSGATLAEAARRMRDANVGALPVVDGHDLVGMITDRDIVIRAAAEEWLLTEKRVADVMTRGAACCSPGDSLEAAASAMADAQVRRLPVKGPGGQIVGMISLGDLALAAPHAVAGDALAAISQHGGVAVAG